jgi:hypothetical protein
LVLKSTYYTKKALNGQDSKVTWLLSRLSELFKVKHHSKDSYKLPAPLGICNIRDCLDILIIGAVNIKVKKLTKPKLGDNEWRFTIADFQTDYIAREHSKDFALMEILNALALGDDHLRKPSTKSLLVKHLVDITKENYKDAYLHVNYEDGEFYGFPFLPYSHPDLITIPFVKRAAELVQEDLEVHLEDLEYSQCIKKGLSCTNPKFKDAPWRITSNLPE